MPVWLMTASREGASQEEEVKEESSWNPLFLGWVLNDFSKMGEADVA